jgi:hypothetical protein
MSILIGIVLLLFYLILLRVYFSNSEKTVVNRKFIRLATAPYLCLIPFIFLYFIPDQLEEKEETLELTYLAWACECANWATPDDIARYHDEGDSLADLSIFIEPANESLQLPDTIGYSGDIIKLTGHFYTKKGFPKGYKSFEQPDRARVFQYTNYEIIHSGFFEVRRSMVE